MNIWLRPLQAVEKKNNEHIDLLLLSPNEFILRKIQKKYLETIRKTLHNITSKKIALSLALSSSALTKSTSIPARQTSFASRLKASQINPYFCFENFVCGPSNEIAYHALTSTAKLAGKQKNPVFIHADASYGKTHLLNALGNQILREHSDKRVYLLQTYHFLQKMVACSITGNFEPFQQYKKHLDSYDVLLVDDIHLLKDRKKTQEEFGAFLKVFLESTRQVVVCCNQSPANIEFITEDLSVCLHGGLPIAINPPALETRIQILKQKSKELEINLSDEIAQSIAKKILNNTRLLEGALNHLKLRAELHGTLPTKDMVDEILVELLPDNQTPSKIFSIEEIQRKTAEYFHLDIQSLKGSKRTQNIALARQIAMCLAKNLTQKSIADIGTAFGNRDRTTVVYACKKIELERKRKSKIQRQYNATLSFIKSQENL